MYGQAQTIGLRSSQRIADLEIDDVVTGLLPLVGQRRFIRGHTLSIAECPDVLRGAARGGAIQLELFPCLQDDIGAGTGHQFLRLRGTA